MKSAILSSNYWCYPSLWKKNMIRFWPLWTLWLVIWLFQLPMQLLNHYDPVLQPSAIAMTEGAFYFSRVTVLQCLTEGWVLIIALACLVMAMAVFSYLYNHRSTGMLHSLPVHRGGLFLTSYLSGLSMLVLPLVVVYGLTILAELNKNALDLPRLTLWLVGMVLYILFFYSFAVFCAQFTGHLFALPIFYCILNGLVYTLYMLVHATFRLFIFGYDYVEGLENFILWLTPAGNYIQHVNVSQVYNSTYKCVEQVRFDGFGYLISYAIIGLVLAGLAYLICYHRQLETAGDVVSVPWVRPIFKYGVAVSASLSFGLWFYFWLLQPRGVGIFGLVVAQIVTGAIGYLGAQMFLQKSFRVFSFRHLRGLIPLCLSFVLVGWMMEADLLKVEDYCPEPDEVMEVTIHGLSSAPYDSGDHLWLGSVDEAFIAQVIQLHQALIDEKEWVGQYFQTGGYNYSSREDTDTVGLGISYTLTDGRTIHRDYNTLLITLDDLEREGSFASLAEAFCNQPSQIQQVYFPDDMSDWVMVMADLSLPTGVTGTGAVVDTEVVGQYSSGDWMLTAEEAQRLFQAVQADMAAGNLGQRYLLEHGTQRLETCYYNDITFYFYVPTVTQSNQPAVVETVDSVGKYDTWITVTLQTTATETLAVLEELGLTEVLALYGEVYG